MKSIALTLLLGCAAIGCGKPFTAATPSGFVDLSDGYPRNEYRATTADGVVIGVRPFDNEPKGGATFWLKAIENRMRDVGGYALLKKTTVKNKTGQAGTRLSFGRDEDSKSHLYDICVFVTEAKVYVIEAGGSKSEVERQKAQLDWAIANFSPG
jgi:hypothetical protein